MYRNFNPKKEKKKLLRMTVNATLVSHYSAPCCSFYIAIIIGLTQTGMRVNCQEKKERRKKREKYNE